MSTLRHEHYIKHYNRRLDRLAEHVSLIPVHHLSALDGALMRHAWPWIWILGALLCLAGSIFVGEAAEAKESVRVAILDTGMDLTDTRFKALLCPGVSSVDLTGEGIQDTHGHGTHVAGLIKEYAGDVDYCMIIIKYFSSKGPEWMNTVRELRGMQFAVANHATVVNFSGGGDLPMPAERNAIAAAVNTLFIVSAGNNHQDLNEPGRYYPAQYGLSNLVVVGALDASGGVADFSNYGSCVSAWELGVDVTSTLPGGRVGAMSGTSMATAIRTGKIIRLLAAKAVRR